MRGSRSGPGWAAFLAIWLSAAGPAAADISYIYDALGRLIGVVDPSSDTVTYQYDAVGNLLSINRYASTTASIIDFDPKSGPAATTVTISGTGFSSTATQNTVTFNGTAATVLSATPTQIVTSVPAGATTGAVAVTAPSGSATTSSPFVVTGPTAPTITSFTPSIGTPGTAVTVSGTNFEPTPSNNRLNFNIARSLISSATATTLDATVPAAATSGRLVLTTPAGVAQSAADFFVPPPGFVVSDVTFTGRLVMNGGELV